MAQSSGPSRRRDLAAMITPLGRALIAAELPVLRAHGLSMWGYVVLTALDGQPIRTQAALAQSIGADKTRIIGVLDDLEQNDLIQRQADPADRRARFISITNRGQRLREAIQTGIQLNEEGLLARLSPDHRRGFLNALQFLSSLSPEEIAGGSIARPTQGE